MRVTKDNFETAMRGLFYGHQISDYNNDCYSTKDIQFHIVCGNNCQEAINNMRTAGYEPRHLLAPVFEKYMPDMVFHAPPNPELKAELDEEFQIEVDGYQVEWGNEWFLKNKMKQ